MTSDNNMRVDYFFSYIQQLLDIGSTLLYSSVTTDGYLECVPSNIAGAGVGVIQGAPGNISNILCKKNNQTSFRIYFDI